MPYFLVVSPGRSGSTSLRLTINSAADTICYGEILGKNRVLGVEELNETRDELAVIRANDSDRFIRILMKDAPQAHRGFKALYTHFFLEQNDPYIDWTLSQKPKVVFLWRRNLVKRYLSECKMRMLEIRSNEHKFAQISESNIARNAQLQMQMARDIRARISGHGISDILDIDFEDMIAGPEVMHQVMDFLGLGGSGYEMRKDPRTLRNEKASDKVEIPASFSAPGIEQFRDVSLEQALQYID